MMTHNEKLKKLVDTLIDKTQSGELNWELAEGGIGARTTLKSSSVLIKPSHDEADQDAVTVVLQRNAGETLVFDDTAILAWTPQGKKFSYYQRMKNLLDSAIRSARGEDKLVNSVLVELGIDPSEDDVPF